MNKSISVIFNDDFFLSLFSVIRSKSLSDEENKKYWSGDFRPETLYLNGSTDPHFYFNYPHSSAVH